MHRRSPRRSEASSVPRTIVAAAVIVVSIAGCFLRQSPPRMRYYTLTPPGRPVTTLPGPVHVAVFTADEPYTSARLAYRSSPYRLSYYGYHRWAAGPRSLVANAVRDYLRQAVTEETPPPFEVTGHILRLEEVDESTGWYGVLAIDLRIRRGGRVLVDGTYAESEAATAHNPEAVVAALSRALGRILDRALSELQPAAAPAPTSR